MTLVAPLNSKRKRSGKVALVAMGLGVSAFALTGCEENVDAYQFGSVENCIISGDFTEAECNERFNVAKTEHQRVAPRYQSRADCEAEHGAAACEPRTTASATEAGGTSGTGETASSGGGLWMPLMIGWMMGRSLGGPVATQPLYRSSQAGKAQTAAGSRVDAKAGPVSVAKSATARPAAGRTMARGGFGRTGSSTGGTRTRSFGG